MVKCHTIRAVTLFSFYVQVHKVSAWTAEPCVLHGYLVTILKYLT